jgi:hypothetical protein
MGRLLHFPTYKMGILEQGTLLNHIQSNDPQHRENIYAVEPNLPLLPTL